MAHWREAVVTRDGIDMLNEMMAGRKLTLTAAYGGTGLEEADSLRGQKDLLRRMQPLHLVDEQDGPDGKTVTVQVENQALAEGYLLQQIGVFARLEAEDGGEAEEKLLFLMQDTGVQIPPMTEESFLLEIHCLLRIDSEGRLKVVVDPAGVVTIQRLRETVDRYRALSGETDPAADTVATIGQRYIDTTARREYVCVGVTEQGCIWKETAGAADLLALRHEMMTGEVTLPLLTAAGEGLLTDTGTPIHARYRLERNGTVMADVEAGIRQSAAGLRAYADSAKQAAIAAAGTDAAAKVKAASDTLSAKIARDIAAHNGAEAAHPTHLTVVTK